MESYKAVVWVGGLEMNDHYLTFSEALTLASAYESEGYDDVRVEIVEVPDANL